MVCVNICLAQMKGTVGINKFITCHLKPQQKEEAKRNLRNLSLVNHLPQQRKMAMKGLIDLLLNS